jgi:hypothetical protein
VTPGEWLAEGELHLFIGALLGGCGWHPNGGIAAISAL